MANVNKTDASKIAPPVLPVVDNKAVQPVAQPAVTAAVKGAPATNSAE